MTAAQFETLEPNLKRLLKRLRLLILKGKTLETLETLPRIYAHTSAPRPSRPKNKALIYAHKRFKRFMRFIPMKTVIFKRFNKRFKSNSSVSNPGVSA